MKWKCNDQPLWTMLRPKPRIANRPLAQERILELAAMVDPDTRAIIETPRISTFLMAVVDHSTYLWQLLRNDPLRLARVLSEAPAQTIERVLSDLSQSIPPENAASIMRRLRLAKQETALVVAFADLGGIWKLETVMQALSRSADIFIAEALAFLLRQAEADGKLGIADPLHPELGCGLTLLGLGKLGGRELNYSSDVDLIAIFDPVKSSLKKPEDASQFYVRLVKDLVRILQTRTAEGYVLRVDLRLRPDPGATAVAIKADAAFHYYEAYGQNWERAAMIKARVVAGDAALGEAFIEGLVPFIWRKYFDFAAIADIHAMKRQIHAVKGHAEIAVAGHNVKLGRGGIREIEFFVQTQQLIFGGKLPDLRGSRTLPTLLRLQRDGWVTRKALGELTRAYVFLRDVEHRLQMIADEQTHTLPIDPELLERFALFAGFASTARFSAVFRRHLARVVYHYRLLFEHAPGLDDSGGSLVFTGIEDDPETIQTLAALGFKAPAVVSRTVRNWHFGRKPGLRSSRARETLTELVPKLLRTFARTFDPDKAIATLDRALERMPAAAELFAILLFDAALLRLFADMLGSAPRLAEAVTVRPHLLDAAIDPTAPAMLDDVVATEAAAAVLPSQEPAEVFLDALRDWANEEHFLVGLRLLSGTLNPDDAGRAYSALAVGVIRAALAHCRQIFEAEHGTVTGGAMAVLAMGKLGSHEMTASSDLDLVVLYDFNAERPVSEGPKRLHATQYYTRLTQRLISYLSAATRRGRLYDIDMRLRPSGRQGPLATKIGAFIPYQFGEAETWEHMALTRARVVAGDEYLGALVSGVVTEILRAPPKPALGYDVASMRALISNARQPASDWDLKLVAGGLLDVEFIAQYMVLRYAGEALDLADPSTQKVLSAAGRLGLLDAEGSETLLKAHRLYTNTTQIMCLALDKDRRPDLAGEGVKSRLAAASGLPSFAHLMDELASMRQAVSKIFDKLLPSGCERL
jgi:glutamate-ammonia-ligase adenylyltransferase